MTTETTDAGRMTPTYGDSSGGASVREAIRALESLASPTEQRGMVTQVTGGSLLERAATGGDPPRLEHARVIEGTELAARRPEGDPVVGFAAFLDGIQASRVLAHWEGGVPIVHGTVAAVVRVRADRRLSTWPGAPLVARAVFLPEALVAPACAVALRVARVELIDTLDGDSARAPRHPLELLALARTAVQRRRELLEVTLAEAWCARELRPLFVDGSISGAGRAARHRAAIGVVKSHRTLYATPETLSVLTGLAQGERTCAFVVSSPRRSAVASWYLRLRDPVGDPFFGLVRVESALESFDPAHADLVSRWILAERVPLAMPDPRWSTMAYGVRDCEEYLRAAVGGR